MHQFLSLLFLLVTSILATAIEPLSDINIARVKRQAAAQPQPKGPLLPNDDPFYKVPPGIQSLKNGDIIRYRPVPGQVTIDNKNPIKLAAAWQILYRTQSSTGTPDATVVTLLVPNKAKPNNLFSLQYFSDAVYNACSPSINLQVGARNDSVFTQSQMVIALHALTQGWYVSIADEEGLQAAFGAGLRMAYGTLDSIRAVKQSGNFSKINPNPITTMYGYSGGGYTAAWTVEVQPTYAPDVQIAGAALGGLVPNFTAAFQLYNKNYRASYIPPGLLGMSKDYKNLSDWIDQNLIPGEKAAEFRKTETQCFDSNEMYGGKDLGQYFKDGWDSLFKGVPLSVLEASGTMGMRATPTIPLYVVETWWDDVSPIALTDAVIRKHCNNGANILYERNDLLKTNHSEHSIWSLPGAVTWLADRHAGKPVQKGCQIIAFTPQSFVGWFTLTPVWTLLSAFLATLGIPVSGP